MESVGGGTINLLIKKKKNIGMKEGELVGRNGLEGCRDKLGWVWAWMGATNP
jgi:hypothetical protein